MLFLRHVLYIQQPGILYVMWFTGMSRTCYTTMLFLRYEIYSRIIPGPMRYNAMLYLHHVLI